MRIKNQDEILDEAVRKKIIEEIGCSENTARKSEAFKRHMIYKDKTEYWVLDLLERQFDKQTVYEMSYAVSNISLVRKIIDKLARVYSGGVTRAVVLDSKPSEEYTNNVQRLEKELNVNTKQKTINRFLKLHRNAACYIKPCPNEYGEYSILLQPLAPHLYDVVEDYYDRTKPMVYVLSHYEPKSVSYGSESASKEHRTGLTSVKPKLGNQKDEVIADSPEDQNKDMEFIWWSDKYHFTTDATGKIISESTENPIGVKPIINYAIDQDNAFWAQGGDDLVSTGVKVNAQISHINFIGTLQGYGQFYYKGKTPPQNMALGPNKGIVLQYEEGDPAPEIGFTSANPQLANLMAVTEMQIAMCLTTNNLTTSGVSTSLGQGTTFPSGIALLIDKSESMEDVKDQEQVFLDNEPVMWDVINKWLMLYQGEGSLQENLVGLAYPEGADVLINFQHGQVITTEAEKLGNIKLRKELGINTQAELIKIDQPGLTDEEAEEKLEKILEDKKLRMKSAANGMEDSDAGEEDELDGEQDQLRDRPVQ